jgi:hypothetical protein
MEDEDLLHTEFLGPHRGNLTLDIVGGHDTEIIDFAGGTVHLRFVGFAGAGLGEAGVGVGGADHGTSEALFRIGMAIFAAPELYVPM